MEEDFNSFFSVINKSKVVQSTTRQKQMSHNLIRFTRTSPRQTTVSCNWFKFDNWLSLYHLGSKWFWFIVCSQEKNSVYFNIHFIWAIYYVVTGKTIFIGCLSKLSIHFFYLLLIFSTRTFRFSYQHPSIFYTVWETMKLCVKEYVYVIENRGKN